MHSSVSFPFSISVYILYNFGEKFVQSVQGKHLTVKDTHNNGWNNNFNHNLDNHQQ